MILIQIFLIVGFLVLLVWLITNPSSYQMRALTKIFAILFFIIAIITVIFPDTTNDIAHWFGVARGADLLLYILTMAFIFGMFSSYIQEKRLQKRIVILARKIAIIETDQRNIDKSK
jgi:hypothetical protein